MLIDSALFSRGSGSLGGLTLSHNAGGIYLRARTMPVNPNSPDQQDIRAALASLVNRWTTVLTAAQRSAWENYAASTPLPGPLGDAREVSGQNMYIRGNVERARMATPLADDAPVIFNLGSFTLLTTPVADVTGQTWKCTYDNTDEWANEDDARMVAYVSRPQNPTINYFSGPFRYAGFVPGNSTTPPTPPLSVTLPFTVVADQRVYARMIVTRADGRLSNDQIMNAIAA